LLAGLANLWISLGKQWPLRRIRRLLPKGDRHKTPASGGLMLAFVGADGAGKSTHIKHIAKWLSWRLEVRTYYMGSSRPSAGTRVWKTAGDLAMFMRAGCRRVFGEQSVLTRLAARAELFCDHLRYLGDAHDRYRRYKAARHAAAGGAIVICDRYPLEHVQIAGRIVDGPRIAASLADSTGGQAGRLAEAEEAIYQRIQPPDHVFALHITPEVSQSRKPGHPRERIEAKSRALQGLAAAGFDLTSIDADQPLDQVLLQIKVALWRLL
jgi:thymidylate kinase